MARQDVASSTSRGSQAYLAVLEHAGELAEEELVEHVESPSEITDDEVLPPEKPGEEEETPQKEERPGEEEEQPQEEEKPHEGGCGASQPASTSAQEEEMERWLEDALADYKSCNKLRFAEITDDEVLPAVNEAWPILCRCRLVLQDGRWAILSSCQTLQEWQALVAQIRAEVEARMMLRVPPAERVKCFRLLRQRWLDSGAPAHKKCKFEGTQKEWEQKEVAQGYPSFKGNARAFRRACANHFRWALTSVVSGGGCTANGDAVPLSPRPQVHGGREGWLL